MDTNNPRDCQEDRLRTAHVSRQCLWGVSLRALQRCSGLLFAPIHESSVSTSVCVPACASLQSTLDDSFRCFPAGWVGSFSAG